MKVQYLSTKWIMKQKNGKYLHKETKHMMILSISSLCELSNKKIILSLLDKTIKVWKIPLNEGVQLIKLTQHKRK